MGAHIISPQMFAVLIYENVFFIFIIDQVLHVFIVSVLCIWHPWTIIITVLLVAMNMLCLFEYFFVLIGNVYLSIEMYFFYLQHICNNVKSYFNYNG